MGGSSGTVKLLPKLPAMVRDELDMSVMRAFRDWRRDAWQWCSIYLATWISC
jgi:hypothetical protein